MEFHDRSHLAVRSACSYQKVVVISQGIALLLIRREKGWDEGIHGVFIPAPVSLLIYPSSSPLYLIYVLKRGLACGYEVYDWRSVKSNVCELPPFCSLNIREHAIDQMLPVLWQTLHLHAVQRRKAV